MMVAGVGGAKVHSSIVTRTALVRAPDEETNPLQFVWHWQFQNAKD